MSSNKVYCGNLSWGTSEQTLSEYFTPYGNITDCIVMTDHQTGRSRGFGFITYENEESVARAIQGMNEQEIDGRVVRVNVATQRVVNPTRPANNFYGGGNPYAKNFGYQSSPQSPGGYGAYPMYNSPYPPQPGPLAAGGSAYGQQFVPTQSWGAPPPAY